ncbi:hypothetical protein FQZ97_1015370 [compost metagenome]
MIEACTFCIHLEHVSADQEVDDLDSSFFNTKIREVGNIVGPASLLLDSHCGENVLEIQLYLLAVGVGNHGQFQP